MTHLIDQIQYNYWANVRLIKAAVELDIENQSKYILSSFPSIKETFIHILWAEELWLERWKGRSFVPALASNKYETLNTIQNDMEDLYDRQIQFLKSLSLEDEVKKVSYLNFQNERWEYSLQQMIQHLLFHSVYHRGQLVTMLRQLGIKPPSTDYLVFIDDKAETGS
jgi:uncharacterized damage-inducible protein DinB